MIGPMRLYIVRHGDAEFAADDFLRELSPRGRAEVARLAEQCAAAGVRPEEIRHSPLVRARQTAEILAARLRPALGVAEMSGTGPEGDTETAALDLGLASGDTLLVSHMPFVARLEGRLATGRAGAAGPAFATAELRAFERSGELWTRVARITGA